jgi:hypothetical protein
MTMAATVPDPVPVFAFAGSVDGVWLGATVDPVGRGVAEPWHGSG